MSNSIRPFYQKTVQQLKRQQEILKVLNFYKGPIDGIWGPESIAAMKKYERDVTFKPCIPNHGMPLSSKSPYPSGIYKEVLGRSSSDLLYHPLLETLKVKDSIEKEKTDTST